jgi:hypothetical protein
MDEQNLEPTRQKRKFWQYPWKYKESFIISACLVIVGFLIQYLTGSKGIQMPVWPVNFFIIVLFVAYIILFNRFVTHPIKKWFSSVPAAIASICIFTFLILLMGFIPQDKPDDGGFMSRIGLTHLVGSWPYLLISFNLLFVLSFTIIRRIYPFTLKNIAFAMNHLGLLIVLMAASLGATDTQKLMMFLEEGKVVFTAYDGQNQPRNLDFAIKLTDFKIEEFIPTLGIVDPMTGELKNKHERLLEAKTGSKATLGNWNITVEKYIENGRKTPDGYDTTSMVGSAPVVYIVGKNQVTGATTSGWVTAGSFMVPQEIVPLDNGQFIAMTIPQTKKYRSTVEVYYESGETKEATIEVNQPIKVNGWKIYQTGFDEEMGKWSTMSYVQLVKDPWLPAVYVGIFMVMAGALYLFWMGRS